MSLHRGTKQFQFERLVYYFVRPGGDSSIDKRPVGKGGSYDHGYVSRRRIRFEPRCGLISVIAGMSRSMIIRSGRVTRA